jgi:predicted O-methyltransferase YrrM
VNETINKIFETGRVVGRSGKVFKLHSAIDREEGEFLSHIIQYDESIVKTLEVGCAFGLSSLFICSALQGRPGAFHTIIDPFQNTQWDGAGLKNLEEAGYPFFTLIENKSEFALPQLLEKVEGQLDFIFVDGWHTFDHTLLDCFYATRLLRVGGYLAIDDVSWASVRRAVDFLSNYPCYELYGSVDEKQEISYKKILMRILLSPVHCQTWRRVLSNRLYRKIFEDRRTRMVALKKVTEDNRNWDWHDEAF